MLSDSGIPDVELSHTTTATGPLSVLTSNRLDVKVKNHTDIFLRVVDGAPRKAVAQ
jgi:hypothetical protein